MIKKNISKLLFVFTLALMLMPCVLYAQFEPSITIADAGTGPIPQQVSGNLNAVITPTADDTTGYDLLRYVYTWNNASTPLSDDDLGAGDTSVPHGATIEISTDADAKFGTSDGLAWYLHVKTVYSTIPDAPGIALSDDTVVGPYTFDNVPPGATISLDETVDGQSSDTTSVSPVTIVVTGNYDDIVFVYVNTSEQFDTATAHDFSDSSTTTLTYAVNGTGSKTLYAWFEDEAGNISDSDDLIFTVSAGKSMVQSDPMDLKVDATWVFAISGGGAETYDWTIVGPATGAEFVGASDDVTTATIKGVTEGAVVKVKAVSTVDVAVYESGAITIVETTPAFSYDVDGNGEYDALTDGILLFRYLFDFTGTTLTNKALGTDPVAVRTDPDEIIAYLNTGKTTNALDVDGNGEYDALTDGILLFRYLFDFTETTLTNKALGTDPVAGRTDPDELITFMNQYKKN